MNEKAEYELIWRKTWLTAQAESRDMVAGLRAAADELQAMKDKGVLLAPDSAVAEDMARFVTDDPDVANEFGFELCEWEEDEMEDVAED